MNDIQSNGRYGIWIRYASSPTVTGNTVANNNNVGIYLYGDNSSELNNPLPVITGTGAHGTWIHGETALDAYSGPDITIDGGGLGIEGIVIEDVTACVVRGLQVIGCDAGLVIRGVVSPGPYTNYLGGPNLGHRNVCTENVYGVLIEGPMGANFVNNTQAVYNTGSGIVLQEGANAATIGGPGLYDYNVCSGNGDHGILLQATLGESVNDNSFEYNRVGVDETGTIAIPNNGDGIHCIQADGRVQ